MTISINSSTFVKGSIPDLPIGQAAQLDTSTSAASYLWEFLSKPDGSNASFSGSTAKNPTFVPDKVGSYLIRLTLPGSVFEFALAYSSQLRTKTRTPAHTEGSSDSGGALAGTRGWTSAFEILHRTVDLIGARGNAFIAKDNGSAPNGLKRGDLVYVATVERIGGINYDHDFLPIVGVADASDYTKIGDVGMVVGRVDGRTTGAVGDHYVIVREGYVGGLDTSAFSIGDVFFVGNGGGIVSGGYTYPRRIGEVVVSDASEGIVRISSRTPQQWAHIIYFSDPTITLTKEQMILAGGEGIVCAVCETDANAIAITLPPLTRKEDGLVMEIKRRGANSVTISAPATYDIEEVGSSTTITLGTTGDSVTLRFEKANNVFLIV